MSKLSNIRVFVDEDKLTIEVDRAGLKKLLDILMEKEDTTPEARTEEPVEVKEEDEGPTESEAESESESEGGDDSEGVDLFEAGPTGVGGELQDVSGGRKMIEEMRAWLKENRFNYKNFCLFLSKKEYLAGWKLKKPLIGTTAKGEPSLFKLAARYYTYWKTAKDREVYNYKEFLADQLEDYGVKVEMIKDILDGKEIAPEDLPKGIEVYV